MPIKKKNLHANKDPKGMLILKGTLVAIEQGIPADDDKKNGSFAVHDKHHLCSPCLSRAFAALPKQARPTSLGGSGVHSQGPGT